MNLLSSLRYLVVALLLAGCSSGDSDYVHDYAEHRPEVDTSLPAEVQAKQDALIRTFAMLQQGASMDQVKEVLTDVRFKESDKKFYDEGVYLQSFAWNGPPSGNNLPVRIVMLKNEPGDPEIEYERVYTVTKKGGVFLIRRNR